MAGYLRYYSERRYEPWPGWKSLDYLVCLFGILIRGMHACRGGLMLIRNPELVHTTRQDREQLLWTKSQHNVDSYKTEKQQQQRIKELPSCCIEAMLLALIILSRKLPQACLCPFLSALSKFPHFFAFLQLPFYDASKAHLHSLAI